MRDVLDGVDAAHRVFALEVERAKVDGIVRLFVQAAKGHADEAALKDILALDVYLDRAFVEVAAREPDETLSGALANFFDDGQIAVDQLSTFAGGDVGQVGVDGFILPRGRESQAQPTAEHTR